MPHHSMLQACRNTLLNMLHDHTDQGRLQCPGFRCLTPLLPPQGSGNLSTSHRASAMITVCKPPTALCCRSCTSWSRPQCTSCTPAAVLPATPSQLAAHLQLPTADPAFACRHCQLAPGAHGGHHPVTCHFCAIPAQDAKLQGTQAEVWTLLMAYGKMPQDCRLAAQSRPGVSAVQYVRLCLKDACRWQTSPFPTRLQPCCSTGLKSGPHHTCFSCKGSGAGRKDEQAQFARRAPMAVLPPPTHVEAIPHQQNREEGVQERAQQHANACRHQQVMKPGQRCS